MIRDFVPPVVFKGLRRLKRLGRGEGNGSRESFASYDDALRACRTDGYEQETLVRVVVEKTRRHREKLPTTPYFASYADTRLFMAMFAAMRTGQPLRVMDFGGAAGAIYFAARAVVPPSVPMVWCVVETAAMAREARRVLGSEELRFVDGIEAARAEVGDFDLVYSSGAIQYVPDPMRTLRALLGYGAPHVLLTRLGLRDHDRPLIGIQHSNLGGNGPGPLPEGFQDADVHYPVTILPRRELERAVKEHYSVVVEFDEGGGAYRFGEEEVGLRGYWARLRG